MSKGIVRGGGSGGGAPTLIVSDPSVPEGADTPSYPIGTELPCLAQIPIAPGDLVEFTLNKDDVAEISARICGGQIITGTHDNVTVTATSAAIIVNATVTGKISCIGGSMVIIGNCVIDGKVDIDNGSTVAMAGVGVKISGKVDSTTNNILQMADKVLVESKLTSKNDKLVNITGCTIDGKIEISGAQKCAITGNTVNGKVSAGPPCVVS